MIEVNKIYEGDALTLLKTFPSEIFNTCVTSPPYYGLRAYGTNPVIWDGDENCQHEFTENIFIRKRGNINGLTAKAGNTIAGISGIGTDIGCICSKCGAWRGELGSEPSPELFVKHIVDIFREVKRTLKKDGTCWINLGDSYFGSGQGYGDTKTTNKGHNGSRERKKPIWRGTDLKPKDLIGIPWMVAFALRADGWYLRSEIIWYKRNPMPESVTDRPTKAHEQIFLLSKNAKYYYDAEAILEECSVNTHARISQDVAAQVGSYRANGGAKTNGPMKAVIRTPKQQPARLGIKNNDSFNNATCLKVEKRNKRSVWEVATQSFSEAHFATFPEKLIVDCIKAGCPEGGLVLDPFAGANTTGLVARKLNRNYIALELNPEYIKIGNNRVYDQIGLFL